MPCIGKLLAGLSLISALPTHTQDDETHANAKSHALRRRRLFDLLAFEAMVEADALLDTSFDVVGAYPGGFGIWVLQTSVPVSPP